MDIAEAGKTIQAFQDLLERTPPEACHVRVAPEAWTLAEIVGHLVDSAGNNHQRFIRLRFGDLKGFPAYDTEPWVAEQGYDAFDFKTLCTLWSSYNALLLHLATTIPETALQNAWHTPDGPLTLEFLTEDYYRHLGLHVDHYRDRLAEVSAFKG